MTMTRALANALKRDRIRINTLNIGWTNTPREHLVQTEVHGRPAGLAGAGERGRSRSAGCSSPRRWRARSPS